MIKRHQDQLMSRLDQLYCKGTTFITWPEIYHWYKVERIVKAPYRDIKEKWGELLESVGRDYEDPLVSLDDPGGITLFYADNRQTLSELAD